MSQEIDYGAVLADLVRRRDELTRTIQTISAISGASAPVDGGPGGDGNGNGGNSSQRVAEVRSDSFFNMKAPEAIKVYLGMAKRPQSVAEIKDALERGGLITQAKELYNNLYTAIKRMENDGVVVKVKEKWGLAEWYPARPKPKPKAGSGDTTSAQPDLDEKPNSGTSAATAA